MKKKKEKQDFPMMIYHVALGNKIVHDPEQLEAHKLLGWTKNYTVISEQKVLQEKKIYHEKELKGINEKLAHFVTSSEPKKKEAAETVVDSTIPKKEVSKKPTEVRKRGSRPRRS